MAKKSKRYTEAAALIENGRLYSAEEAIELVKKTSNVKFDASVDVAFNLGLDVRQADQQLRGAVVLPHGTGKTKKVLVVAEGEKAQEAKDAGADIVAGKEILEDIKKGWLDFEVMIATPNMMAELGKLGRILGPKGLMPNPKAGTVTMDVTKAVNDIKAGKIEYRLDKANIIHVPIGKASFSEEQLADNFQTLIDAVNKAKPATLKGQYMKSVSVAPTMGPGVKINPLKLV